MSQEEVNKIIAKAVGATHSFTQGDNVICYGVFHGDMNLGGWFDLLCNDLSTWMKEPVWVTNVEILN